MRAVLTAVIAAIEAAAVALAGFALIAVPTVLVWWLTFDLGADPGQVFDVAAAGWLLAHLVPIGFQLAPEAALGYGLAPESLSFTLSLAPLGITALTALLAARAGWRFADRGGVGAAGVLGGLLGFGLSAGFIAILGETFRTWPLWLAALVPGLCFAVCSGSAYVLRAALTDHDWWRASVRAILRGFEPLNSLWAAALPNRATETFRFAAASLLALLGLGALGTTVAIVLGYVGIITLSQSLQLDFLGLLVVFLLSVVLMPVVYIWALAWFTGAGFSIGAGTSVTPFETLLGPLPAFPLLGAVPQGWGWAGGFAPAIVVLLGVVIGVYGGARSELRRSSLGASIVVPVLAAALAGLAVAGLCALATGSVGPGRLGVTGPQPWPTGGLAALELALGLVPGVLASRLDLERLRSASPLGARTPDRPLTSAPGEFDPLGDPVPFERVRDHSDAAAGAGAAADSAATAPATADAVGFGAPETNAGGDAEATVELLPLREDPSPRPRSDEPRPAEVQSVEAPPADPLLSAFAWDSAEVGEGDPSEAAPSDESRRGWRPPWRKR